MNFTIKLWGRIIDFSVVFKADLKIVVHFYGGDNRGRGGDFEVAARDSAAACAEPAAREPNQHKSERVSEAIL